MLPSSVESMVILPVPDPITVAAAGDVASEGQTLG